MKLAIIIPAFNEGSAIKSVILSLPKKLKGVNKITSIVVDDGSGDNTYEVAKKYADFALSHVVNLGVGAATTTGIEAAKKLKADIAITLDGDGQHNPADIESVIAPVVEGRADIVIGTRMMNSAGMPRLKIMGNWLMNFVTFLVFGQWTSDSQSGMKAFSQRTIRKMRNYAIGYEICSEIVGEAKRNKLKLVEVPIEVIYSDYSKSKGQSVLNAINILTKIITIRFMGKK